MQPSSEPFQKVPVGRDLFGSRVVVRHIIAAHPRAVGQRVVEGGLVARVELAFNAVAVARPPLAARAEAAPPVLLALAQIRALPVEFLVLVLRHLIPGAGGLVVDALTLIAVACHVRYLRSLLPNRRHRVKKERGQPSRTGNLF